MIWIDRGLNQNDSGVMQELQKTRKIAKCANFSGLSLDETETIPEDVEVSGDAGTRCTNNLYLTSMKLLHWDENTAVYSLISNHSEALLGNSGMLWLEGVQSATILVLIHKKSGGQDGAEGWGLHLGTPI
ncbi:hypothetical protein DFH08DRAFT_799210 [Mycena albidolilacea]|uniref:Uncharacterized protein n=1 Tax=Mycena albidolilacea TaxID=1033008 RepID=A0AAD7F3Y6_9AGAR|nr:hypothetical protein DFH08DRAFT_799210 [Mycena albidolilacea]